MPHRRTRLTAGATALVMAVILALLAWPAATLADEHRTLKIGFVTEPDTMNPFVGYGGSWVNQYTYELLTSTSPDHSGVIRPYYASSWEASNEGKTWTYHIDPDKKWSDGTPATARDAAYTLKYIIDSRGTDTELNLGFNSTAELGLIESADDVKVIDDQTLQIDYTQAQADPPLAYVFVMPEHILSKIAPADVGKLLAVTDSGDLPLVGSGDYIATEWQSGQFIRLMRNPYKDAPANGVDEVVFVFYGTPDAQAAALASGEIDVALDLPAPLTRSLEGNADVQIFRLQLPELSYLAFNTLGAAGGGASDALADPAFRDALGYAIDKDALIATILTGLGEPGLTMVSPALADFDAAIRTQIGDGIRTFDLTAAAAKLDAAGYEDSDGDGVREDKAGRALELRLLVQSDRPDFVQAAQFITDWFGQVGVVVSTSALDVGTVTGLLTTPDNGGGDWDMVIWRIWPGQRPGALLAVGNSAFAGTSNIGYYSNPRFDELAAEVDSALVGGDRVAMLAEAAALYYAEAPSHVLWYPVRLQPRRIDRFTGWLNEDISERYPDQVVPVLTAIEAPTASEDPGTSAAPSASTPAETAAPSASPVPGEPASGSSDNTPLLIGGAIAIVVIGGGALLLRRRNSAA